MTFNQFTYVLKGRTLFRNGDVDVGDRRLSLWCSAGLIVRLAKGLYRLAKHDAYDPFELAALLSPRSYITSWSALEYCGFLSKSYRGPLISAHEGRAFEREIEGRVYRFLKIRNCESRQVVRYGEFSFAVADPYTAVLDLCHRREPPLQRSTPIRYEFFDTEYLLARLLETRQSSKRRAIGRLLALARLYQKQKLGVLRGQPRGVSTFSPDENP